MTGRDQAEPPDEGAGGSADRPAQPWVRLRRRRPAGEAPEAGRHAGLLAPWLQWVRAPPLLAAAVLVFCGAAIGGLLWSVPPGLMSAGRSTGIDDPSPGTAAHPAPADPAAADPGPRSRAGPADPAPRDAAPIPGPWLVKPASTPSPRGLALVYAYRALPPGGDSRYEWFVRLQGPQSLLDRIEVVSWRMDPPPRDGDTELLSRNRARDGFPLMGHGPGGWFGVSATVRFEDGDAETLSRRVDLPN